MEKKYLVTDHPEIRSLEKLDELYLYIQLSKYERTLADLKNNAAILPGKVIQFDAEETHLKNMIEACIETVKNFGIDTKDREEIQAWKHACGTFLDSLTMEEYIFFMQQRATGQGLNIFCPAEEGKSSFYTKKAKEKSKELIKAMQIS